MWTVSRLCDSRSNACTIYSGCGSTGGRGRRCEGVNRTGVERAGGSTTSMNRGDLIVTEAKVREARRPGGREADVTAGESE